MKAQFVKDIGVSGGNRVSTDRSQKLWRLDTPYEYEPGEKTEHVVTSTASVFGRPETYIFPADADGHVTDWGELPGSYKGDLDHDTAIEGFLDEVGAA
jgi:hypothetical protein